MRRKRRTELFMKLYLYEEMLRIQLDHIEIHINREDLSEEEKKYWTTFKNIRERDPIEFRKILNE